MDSTNVAIAGGFDVTDALSAENTSHHKVPMTIFAFQANTRTISVTNELLATLVNLGG